jgi:hypothetical protein
MPRTLSSESSSVAAVREYSLNVRRLNHKVEMAKKGHRSSQSLSNDPDSDDDSGNGAKVDQISLLRKSQDLGVLRRSFASTLPSTSHDSTSHFESRRSTAFFSAGESSSSALTNISISSKYASPKHTCASTGKPVLCGTCESCIIEANIRIARCDRTSIAGCISCALQVYPCGQSHRQL